MVDIATTPQYETPEDYKSGLADILKEAKNQQFNQFLPVLQPMILAR